ncbi:oligosaccharide flippase family protein [uncultured Polaribacter sp.]|uniref:oligosaccharide flippase family protein n=1 Tax=uncultured Polaribacter sp. TaxID=174711 RepID=UPI002609A1E7|nr:oligosaccharide flippase family protein [uncultured Polaribacter sp.]
MKNKFISNLLISGGASYISRGLLFLSSMITARLLTPEDFGIVALVTVFTGFLNIFSDSGISIAVIRSEYGNLYHRGLSTLLIYLGLTLMVLTFLISYPISIFYNKFELVFIAPFIGVMFLTNSMSGLASAVLNKQSKFKVLGLFEVISTVLSIVLIILFAWSGFKYWSIILPQLLISIIRIITFNYYANFNLRLLSWKYVRVSFEKTKNLIGHISGFNLVNYWSRNFDNLIVGKIYGADSLGIYGKAYGMLMLPISIVNGAINKVAFPTMVTMMRKGDGINSFYFTIMNVIFLISTLIGIPLILFPKSIVIFLWGNQWLRVSDILPYFGVLVLTQLVISFSGNIILIKKKDKQYMYFGWITGVFIITGIYVGSLFSFEAIPLTYAIAFLIGPLSYNAFYVHIKHLGFSVKEMIKLWMPMIIVSYLFITCIYFKYDFFIKLIISVILILYSFFKNRNLFLLTLNYLKSKN